MIDYVCIGLLLSIYAVTAYLIFLNKKEKHLFKKVDDNDYEILHFNQYALTPNQFRVENYKLDFSPGTDETLIEQVKRVYKERVYIYKTMRLHELMWGVPCGPTLSMCKSYSPVGVNTDHNFKANADGPFIASADGPFIASADSVFRADADNTPSYWPMENPFINDINGGLLRQDKITKYNVESFIRLNPELTKNKSPYDPYYKIKFEYGFDLSEWEGKLLSLINEIVDTEQPEVAIEALPIYDKLRKMMDIMQAVPPAKRKI